MISLEALLRETARKGELNYLSLIPDGKGGWEASYSPASRWAHNIAAHTDPVEAIHKAITGCKPARRSKADSDLDFG